MPKAPETPVARARAHLDQAEAMLEQAREVFLCAAQRWRTAAAVLARDDPARVILEGAYVEAQRAYSAAFHRDVPESRAAFADAAHTARAAREAQDHTRRETWLAETAPALVRELEAARERFEALADAFRESPGARARAKYTLTQLQHEFDARLAECPLAAEEMTDVKA